MKFMRNGGAALRWLWLVLALALLPAIACAQTSGAAAQAFIAQNVQKGLGILNDTALNPADRRTQFEALLLQITDLNRVAAFTLGSYAKGASDSDVNAFKSEFQNYAVAVYQSYFARYSGQVLSITGTVEHAPGDTIVSTVLVSPHGGAPLPIAFRVMDESGKPAIVDFSIEGVWLAQEERDQFVAFLNQHDGSIPALTGHLKQIETSYR